MSAQVEKKEETTAVAKSKSDKKLQQKLTSVVFIWVTFVVLYLAVFSGNEAFMWTALGLTVVAMGLLYARN